MTKGLQPADGSGKPTNGQNKDKMNHRNSFANKELLQSDDICFLQILNVEEPIRHALLHLLREI